MTTPQAKLRFRERAISALLTCRTIKKAAEEADVSERTMLRWMKDESFCADYERAKRELLSGAINRLRLGSFDAAMRLHRTVVDRNAPVAVAVSASGRLLDILLEAVKHEDLSHRLDKLEELIEKGDL
ncbi:MAG: hypothetical protein WCE63_23290 [Acidobacteriaceae bacterium]